MGINGLGEPEYPGITSSVYALKNTPVSFGRNPASTKKDRSVYKDRIHLNASSEWLSGRIKGPERLTRNSVIKTGIL